MKIQSYLPQNSILRKSIRCIYVIEQNEDESSESFLILPSISAYLSVSQNVVSYEENERIVVESSGENQLDSSVQFGLKGSTIYEYRGNVKEICIVFNPLCIFNFFNEDVLLKSSANGESFVADIDYEKRIDRILNLPHHAEIIAEIEKYLLEKHSLFSHPYLPQAMAALEVTDTETHATIEELAAQLKITRQTLNNQFKKYLNLTASEFRQICRFRRFIQAKLIDENKSKLTDFVYDFGFFDQSHLIKEFKKYTFLKPNDFFRKLDRSKDNSILVIWQ
jgi:AraC-like DNA-binding protein